MLSPASCAPGPAFGDSFHSDILVCSFHRPSICESVTRNLELFCFVPQNAVEIGIVVQPEATKNVRSRENTPFGEDLTILWAAMPVERRIVGGQVSTWTFGSCFWMGCETQSEKEGPLRFVLE